MNNADRSCMVGLCGAKVGGRGALGNRINGGFMGFAGAVFGLTVGDILS